MSVALSFDGQEDAIDYNDVFLTAQDINNRYYYEYSRDWAVLFGCDACKKAYELADANSQEGFKAAFDDAFAYTDF